MSELLNNPWTINIGSGIISGVVVFIVTKWVLGRKDKSRYLKQIATANIEIIQTLKPYVAEKGLPDKKIIMAILSSIARKYKVRASELFSIPMVCEELINEIIGNVYVSADKKEEYSCQLKDYLERLDSESYKESPIEQSLQSDTEMKLYKRYNTLKSENRMTLSVLFSSLTTIVTIVTMFSLMKDQIDEESLRLLSNFFWMDNEQMSLFLIIFSILYLALLLSAIMLVAIRLQRKLVSMDRKSDKHATTKKLSDDYEDSL